MLELFQKEASDPVPVQWLGRASASALSGGSVVVVDTLSRLLGAIKEGWPNAGGSHALVPNFVVEATSDAEELLRLIADETRPPAGIEGAGDAEMGGVQEVDLEEDEDEEEEEVDPPPAKQRKGKEVILRAKAKAGGAPPSATLQDALAKAEGLVPKLRDRSRSPTAAHEKLVAAATARKQASGSASGPAAKAMPRQSAAQRAVDKAQDGSESSGEQGAKE